MKTRTILIPLVVIGAAFGVVFFILAIALATDLTRLGVIT